MAYTIAALVASIAYSALFLLLGTVSLHAVVLGLVYALVWEALFGSLVPGARTLSVQQWSLALAEKVGGGGAITSDVGLPLATVLLIAVTVAATWYAGQKLRTLKLMRRGVSAESLRRDNPRPVDGGCRMSDSNTRNCTDIGSLSRMRGGNWNP